MALILWLLNFFLVVVLPLVIALLLAALVSPVVAWLTAARHAAQARRPVRRAVRHRLLALLVTFVGNQVSSGRGRPLRPGDQRHRPDPRLAARPARCTSPTPSSAPRWTSAQDQLQSFGEDAVGRLGEVGTAVGHVVAGIFIVLFATYFFLADGHLIWAWLVRHLPARRPPPRRLLGPGRVGVADPVRAGHRAGGGAPTRSAS